MGILHQPTTDRRVTLLARQVIGRSPHTTMILDDGAVSAEHAVLAWSGVAWTLRDLGSRNGTFVDGARIGPGEERPLSVGSRVAFGRADQPWVLESDAGPRARAVSGDRIVESIGAVLSLPPGDEPELAVYEIAAGRWVCETPEGAAPIADQAVVVAGGASWRLTLPAGVPETLAAEAVDLRVAPPQTRFEFAVSRDQEHVALVVHRGGRAIDVPPRAHHYMLLTLARLRLEDAADPDLPPSSHGWVHLEDLSKMLGLEPAVVNVQVFRARRQLGALGIDGAGDVVERRPDARQLRLAVASIEVRTV